MSEFPRINVTWAMDNMLHDGALIPNMQRASMSVLRLFNLI